MGLVGWLVAASLAAEPGAPPASLDEPVPTEPVAPEPAAPEPVAPEPVAPEPVAPEPVAPDAPLDAPAEAPSDGGAGPEEEADPAGADVTEPSADGVDAPLSAASASEDGAASSPEEGGPRRVAGEVRTLGVSVAARGGYDRILRNPVVGLDVAVHPDNLRGVRFTGRLTLGAALSDLRPFGAVEAGFAVVVPTEETLVRVGAMAKLSVLAAPRPLPFQPGDPDGTGFGAPGFFPGGLLLAEVGGVRPGGPVGAWAVGVRVGVSATIGLVACRDGSDGPCYGEGPQLDGGFYARVRFKPGFFLEAIGGPGPWLCVGWAFQVGRRQLVEVEVAPPRRGRASTPAAVGEEIQGASSEGVAGAGGDGG